MKITILYNNETNQDLKSGWGFSCLIEKKEKILFDTGDSGSKLMYNMRKLNIEPEDIDKIVLSHKHWDHIGGLRELLKVNNKPEVFYPESFSKPVEICPGVYSTGALGTCIKEQSLVISTARGNIVVTGCAHPGLENILERAKRLGKIYGVLGGFHEFSKLQRLQGIQLIAPCHCTQYKQEIKEKYPVGFKEIKVASVIEV